MNAQKRVERMKRHVIRTTPDTFYYELPWLHTDEAYAEYQRRGHKWSARMAQKHFGKNPTIVMTQEFDIDRNLYRLFGRLEFPRPKSRAEMTLELSERIQEGSITVNAARRQLGYYDPL